MKMQRLLPLLLVLGLTVACGDDGDDIAGPTEVTMTDLAGNWVATDLEIRSLADSTRVLDLAEEYGWEMTFTLDPNGCYIITQESSETGRDTNVGTMRMRGSQLIVWGSDCRPDEEAPEEPQTLDFVYGGNTLDLLYEIRHRFEGEPDSEPALQVIKLRRL